MSTDTNATLLIDCIKEALLEKKADKIVLLDLRELTSLTDYFFVCEATTDTQVRAIMDNVVEKVKEDIGERVWKKEGTSTFNWVVLDYVNVVVHILNTESREYYNIEGMWNDAPRTEIVDEPRR